ncbi:MAG: asparaginase [Actinomycetota bacterium]|nr:asparaginase [Actinomycetota bacterium]MEC8969550.1 asparaginase [Actinomycetota bacterium]MEC8983144.1 asparaginase [Actinomycetota bacterium]
MNSPLIVEVTRGDRIESRHEVDAVVVDSLGRLVESWGEPHRAVLPRSALKPIQALPLVDTGASDAFGLTDTELALACASHQGERRHEEVVTAWLSRLPGGTNSLACGAHPPLSEEAGQALAASGRPPTAVHNNCSGKHAGFLTVIAHLGFEVDGYLDPEHPLHVDHVTPAIERTCGVDLGAGRPAIDGCGIPVWSVALDRLANGWANLGESTAGSSAHRLLSAMRAEPFMVAGTGRACTRLIGTATGGTVAKAGAEGVFCAVVPDEHIGLALKARDGGARAAEAAATWLLAHLGHLDAEPSQMLVNRAGRPVGEVRVAS